MNQSPTPRPAFVRRPLPLRRVPRRRQLLSVSAGAVAFVIALAVAWHLAALTPRGRSVPERAPGARTIVAVLPFADADRGQQYFGDGVAEDIAAALARYRGLAVIARNSSDRYGATRHDAVRAGRALGARYVVTGSVRHDAENTHIIATLTDATHGTRVWSERINWPVDGFFDAQRAIVDGIVEQLGAGADGLKPGAARSAMRPSLAAYDRFLLARQLLQRRGESDRPGAAVLAARRLLERALAEHPGFAPFYSTLAETYRIAYAERMRHPALDGEFGDRSTLDRAVDLATRATSLDDDSAEAWAELGWILRWRPPLDDSIAAFERARTINPGVVDPRVGEPLVLAGRAVEAVPIIEQAMRLDPLAAPETIATLGHAYYLLGDYGKAIDVLVACVRTAPRSAFCHRLLAAAYSQMGRDDEAARHAAEAMRDSPGWTITAVARAGSYRRQEDLERIVSGYRKAGLPE